MKLAVSSYSFNRFGSGPEGTEKWNTLEWDPFMASRGEEPPLAGYSYDDGYKWSIESFQIASYHAERRGVVIGLENHWGFTGTSEGVRRIINGTGSPWLEVALDIGNFVYEPDQYAEIAALAPYAAIVHAKTYVGGGMYYDANLDYRRVRQILDGVGYRGYLSIEFEGKAHPNQGIPESVAILREALRD